MVRVSRAAYSLFIVLLTLGLACTIIEDSDIKDASQFANKKIKSIDVEQQTTKGSKSSQIKLLFDSVKNIVDPATGVKVVRRQGYSLQDLGNLKMKLRSGTTGNTEFFISYKEGEKPYTFSILKGDSIVEVIRFRYDANNRLNKIVTIINPIDNQPAKIFTSDTLIYLSSEISRIIRRSSDPAQEATIDILYGGDANFRTISQFSYLGFRYSQGGGACPQGNNSQTCSGYALQPSSGNQPSGSENQTQFAIVTSFQFNQLVKIQLADVKINAGPSGSRDYGTFYFNPLMIFRDEFSEGKILLGIYSIDWFVPGPVLTSTNFTQNETVNFNFNYGF